MVLALDGDEGGLDHLDWGSTGRAHLDDVGDGGSGDGEGELGLAGLHAGNEVVVVVGGVRQVGVGHGGGEDHRAAGRDGGGGGAHHGGGGLVGGDGGPGNSLVRGSLKA